MRRTLLALSSVSLLGLLLVGCGDAETSSDDSPGGSDPTGDTVCATTDAKDDLLAQICDKGVLTVSTDPAYPPQSKYVPKEEKYEGFDIDVATEIANRLGVDIAWETPAWEVITAGGWNGRWDMSIGSMTADQRPAEGARLHRALLLHSGRGPGERRQHVDPGPLHRPGRQEDRRVQRLHLRAVPRQVARQSRATRSTSSWTTPSSVATTPTRPRCRTWHSVTAPDWMPSMTSATTAEGYVDEGNDVKVVGDPLFYEPLACGDRQERGPRPGQPGRGRGPDRQRHARRWHAQRDVEEVVRRARPHGPAVTEAPGDRWERIALASARVPFQLKVAAVWAVLFAGVGFLFYLSDYDTEWMKDNFTFIAGGLRYTVADGARRHHHRHRARHARLAGAVCRRTRSPTASPASTSRSSAARR